MRFARMVLSISAALGVAYADAAQAAWSDYKDEQEIFAVVPGDDGPREVKIWLVVLDDQGFIRTRNTSWRPALENGANVTLKIRDQQIPIRAVPVKDPQLYDRVNEAYTAKYGVMPHVFLSVMRPFMGPWNVYRVEER